MIGIGASGLSYKDGVGPYYLPERGELAFYACEFSTCELNFPYRLPNAKTLARMAQVATGLYYSHSRCSGNQSGCRAGATTRVVSTFDV
jgi:uncharacterized protein YecE (DUF72 family)